MRLRNPRSRERPVGIFPSVLQKRPRKLLASWQIFQWDFILFFSLFDNSSVPEVCWTEGYRTQSHSAHLCPNHLCVWAVLWRGQVWGSNVWPCPSTPSPILTLTRSALHSPPPAPIERLRGMLRALQSWAWSHLLLWSPRLYLREGQAQTSLLRLPAKGTVRSLRRLFSPREHLALF